MPSGRTVVCASAGNFGQAVAYAGAARGVAVRVYTATTANPAKVARIRELGAEVTQTGADFDAAKDAARAAAEHDGHLYVEDGREPGIAEGAGTIGVELAPLEIGTLLVPVGNGALITGVGRWMKEHAPGTRIIGVCAAGAPSMAESWRAGRIVATESAATLADGIAVREPIDVAVAWMTACVDDMLLVTEDNLVTAQRLLRDTTGLLTEPSAVAGLAALLQHGHPGGTAATIITGANLSTTSHKAMTSEPPPSGS